MNCLQHPHYRLLSAIVISSTIFLWPIELGPDGYDVGLHVYVALGALIVYLPHIIRRFDVFPAIFCAIFVLYFALSTILNGFDSRSALMAITFVLYFYGVYYSLLVCLKDNFQSFKKVIVLFLVAQLCLQVADIFGVFHLYDFNTVRMYVIGSIGSTGLYGEGSHVAISLVPLIFLKDQHGRHLNVNSILATISVLLGISATAFVGVLLLVIFLVIRINSALKVAAAVAFATFILSIFLVGWYAFGIEVFSPVARRVWGFVQIFNGDVRPGVNLSSMVYANGAHMAWLGLNDIIGSGLGNFSSYFDRAVASASIQQISHGPLNKDDGSCVLFKLIGEMGIFGVTLVIYFGLSTIIVINRFGNCTVSVIGCFLLMATIRSAGYFHGPYILSFALIGALVQVSVLWPHVRLHRHTEDLNCIENLSRY